ncbi:SoxR reducing system RseC family protein [Thermovenabulum sp.]|uniref:SoxR reducing system RseC family protein n=1 Tax=Thermovenabulum sp. TaxID=3100335 RepID=UPI003C7D4B1D
MREKALVLRKVNDEAELEVLRGSACGSCKGCPESSKKKRLIVWAKDTIGVESGQLVEIEMEAKGVISATFIMYLFPLIVFLLGVAGGYEFAPLLNIKLKEPFALLTGIIGLAISYLFIYLNNRRFEKSQIYKSKIVNIIDKFSK